MVFKEINIYTGYSENGVESITPFQTTGLLEATLQVERNQLNRLKDDTTPGHAFDDSYYKEFFGKARVKNDIGIVGNGEENVIIVLDEANKWFHKVDHFDAWSEELMEEWNEFLGDLLS